MTAIPTAEPGLQERWDAKWQESLAAWSRFTKLSPPRWCNDPAQEKKQGLTGSFAMIRLVDHAIVISLRQIHDLQLDPYAAEIMAHEIGHHVYAPGDLRDNARLLACIRAGLPTREAFSGLVANLYTDLLINDRLQRNARLDMASVYKALRSHNPAPDRVWQLYMRIYEVLWSLPAGTLVDPIADPPLQMDAGLGARVVRAYAANWIAGAGRFAMLFLTYLLEYEKPHGLLVRLPPWMDADEAGAGGEIPDGLAEIGEDEEAGAIHPAEDPDLSGISGEDSNASAPHAGGRETQGGIKNTYRTPQAYTELLKGLGVDVPEKELVMRYYRERAIPYLIRFPVKEISAASDPYPEGVDVWDVGSPLQEIDWTETLSRSPVVIPGVTTVQRVYGVSEGELPEKTPLDLYVGIDCSGSMGNPALQMSFPVLAGTIVGISALRAGARVMACLSGESPGEFSQTDGFVRSEKDVMRILTGYHGTGYSFGIGRLKDTFLKEWRSERKTHIIVVSDSDMFQMLNSVKTGWDIAREAMLTAGGGGTFVLELAGGWRTGGDLDRMREIGWNVWIVSNQEELVAFAHEFARKNYEREKTK